MKTIVLDIETIPDALAMERCGYKQDETFAPWPLHELACASVLTVTSRGFDPLAFELQSFTRGTMSERGIVASVEEAIDGASVVVTYNGTAFDLPGAGHARHARAAAGAEFGKALRAKPHGKAPRPA